MTRLAVSGSVIVDSSVAIKWVVAEQGTDEALSLKRSHHLAAPDLIFAECANVLWKKVQRSEHSEEETEIAAKIIANAEIESVQSRALFEAATSMAIDLSHPAYDCLYLALALERNCPFVTADTRLVNKLRQFSDRPVADLAIPLAQAPTILRAKGPTP